MAEDQDKDSKTEEPTDRKIERAREEGQVPMSQEIKSLLMISGILASVMMMAPWIMGRLEHLLGGYLTNMHSIRLDTDGFRIMLVGLMSDVGLTLLPVVALLYVLAILGGVGQVGLMFTPKKIAPKLSNISPLSGFKRIFSKNQLMELFKSVVKLVVVCVVLGFMVVPRLQHPEVYAELDFRATMDDLYELILLVLFGTLISFGAVAAADWWWQRHRHLQQLKMTKQEVKDEHKDTEGNPEIKAKIRSLRMQKSRQRMMQAVPDASVIITNPTHYAVALRYDMDDMAAPKLVAKGIDNLARKIREVAEQNDVPIVENPPLARALYASVELDREIPPDHYKAVAEVIGYVMRLKKSGSRSAPPPRWQEVVNDPAAKPDPDAAP